MSCLPRRGGGSQPSDLETRGDRGPGIAPLGLEPAPGGGCLPRADVRLLPSASRSACGRRSGNGLSPVPLPLPRPRTCRISRPFWNGCERVRRHCALARPTVPPISSGGTARRRSMATCCASRPPSPASGGNRRRRPVRNKTLNILPPVMGEDFWKCLQEDETIEGT
ncbi:MAG: hypothetical protein FD149_2708 [Rhodospirillaceae bacterium]|nr:MAG: hypothetical protein FD149_2708 [Rhodospirillaceae bacterium]